MMPTKKKKHIKKTKASTSKIQSVKSAVSKKSIGEKASNTAISLQKISNTCDKGGVKRIYSPFNRFASNRVKPGEVNPNKMSFLSDSHSSGLSSKEKSYVIYSCASRSKRYARLKQYAANAIQNNKIFTIYGSCSVVRKALIERGWVEKIHPYRMNLTKIRNGTVTNKSDVLTELERLFLSNAVEKYEPNFIWHTSDTPMDLTTIDMSKIATTSIINVLKPDALWTTKQGLCSSLKRNYWFYIEDVAEVISPRTYNSFDCEEDEFVKDYKLTACTSLLKWVLSMVANERHIFKQSGKISINVLLFALNRCKEYLFRKQNKDIDKAVFLTSNGQWNAFLKKYYRIISQMDVFEQVDNDKFPLYMGYAKFLLKEMHRYRPQLSCEGCHNIWIIKPAHCSRGRGIKLASQLMAIIDLLNKTNGKYVVQKYIEDPLLIHETKFDIRQYYLVTSTYPLIIWMYQECYLKFSTQKYNLKNFHESIHLTNNAVQKKYMNCTGRHPDLPQKNMWDLNTFKEYLKKIGRPMVWDNIIYPGMRKSIIAIMLSCQDSVFTVSKNRFELYGCDFILDKEFKPWLIEINAHPDLNRTTPVTARICPAVITDIIKVVIDRAADPKAPTGKFECIYRQPMTVPKYGAAAELHIRGNALPNDYFYRGKIEIKPSSESISTGSDVNSIIDKLKIYDDNATDIMIEPEDDYYVNINENKQDTNVEHSTQSENELSVAATVITEQLDDLVNKITTEHETDNSNTLGSWLQSLPDGIGQHSLLQKYASFHPLNLQEDNQSKKLNNVEYRNLQKALYNFDINSDVKQLRPEQIKEKTEIENMCAADNDMLQAARNIITFINAKESEYFRSQL